MKPRLDTNVIRGASNDDPLREEKPVRVVIPKPVRLVNNKIYVGDHPRISIEEVPNNFCPCPCENSKYEGTVPSYLSHFLTRKAANLFTSDAKESTTGIPKASPQNLPRLSTLLSMETTVRRDEITSCNATYHADAVVMTNRYVLEHGSGGGEVESSSLQRWSVPSPFLSPIKQSENVANTVNTNKPQLQRFDEETTTMSSTTNVGSLSLSQANQATTTRNSLQPLQHNVQQIVNEELQEQTRQKPQKRPLRDSQAQQKQRQPKKPRSRYNTFFTTETPQSIEQIVNRTKKQKSTGPSYVEQIHFDTPKPATFASAPSVPLVHKKLRRKPGYLLNNWAIVDITDNSEPS